MFRLMYSLGFYVYHEFIRPFSTDDLKAAWDRYGDRYEKSPEHQRKVLELQQQLRKARQRQGYDA